MSETLSKVKEEIQMKKHLILMVLFCSLIVAIAGCSNPEQTASLETVAIVRGDLIVSIPASGNMEAVNKKSVGFQTTGTIQEVQVQRGDAVVKEQVLATLDSRTLEKTIELRQIDCDDARKAYTSAVISLAKAENYRDYLDNQAMASDINKDDAQYSVDSAEIALERAALQIERAQKNLDIAILEREKTIIAAPFDGIIADISIKEGDQVLSPTEQAMLIIDLDELEMNGIVDEIDISRVMTGQQVLIVLDALPDREITGRVSSISMTGTIRAGVVSYEIIVATEGTDRNIKDGMTASAEIIVERYEDILLIPNRAIRGSLASPWVEIVTADGTVEQRQITTGASNGSSTEIISGLKEGEEVVLPASTQTLSSLFGL